jgi:hypothetical protein
MLGAAGVVVIGIVLVGVLFALRARDRGAPVGVQPVRLFNASLGQWLAATDENRHASCEMILTNSLLDAGVDPRSLRHDEVRGWAMLLADCVTRAAEANAEPGATVAAVAERCIRELNLGPGG